MAMAAACQQLPEGIHPVGHHEGLQGACRQVTLSEALVSFEATEPPAHYLPICPRVPAQHGHIAVYSIVVQCMPVFSV